MHPTDSDRQSPKHANGNRYREHSAQGLRPLTRRDRTQRIAGVPTLSVSFLGEG